MQATQPSATMPLVAGAALGGAAVALGAFGAHAMKAHYDEAALRTFEVGVRYQIYHALALLACGALQASGVRARLAAWLFLIGTALFSGSLYGISLASWTWLGPVTPIGGVALLAGWIALAIAARNRS